MSDGLTPFRNLRGEPVFKIGEINPRLERAFEREFALPRWSDDRKPTRAQPPRKRRR